MKQMAHTYQISRLTRKIGLYLVATLLACVFVLPLIWALSTSLKPDNQLFVDPPVWIPSPIVLQNYVVTFQLAPFGRYFYNTIFITVFAGLGRVVSSIIVAYGFARYEFPGKSAIFAALLSTMMIPYVVLLVPQYLLFNYFGWINSYLPLTVPFYFGTAGFMVFLGRQFIRTIPRELDQAAEIDGCGPLRTLLNVILPNAKAFVATATILSFQQDWNSFLAPLVYLQNQDKYTLALGIRYLAALGGGVAMAGKPVENYVMAATLIVSIPVIIIFLSFQRYFVRGVVMSGIKG